MSPPPSALRGGGEKLPKPLRRQTSGRRDDESTGDEYTVSPEVYARVFLGGMLFLHFATNLLYLTMLLRLAERRSSFWAVVLGARAGRDPSGEHVHALAERTSSRGWTPVAQGRLLAHGVVLAVNLEFRVLAPGLFVNGVLATLALASAPPGDVGPEGGAMAQS